MAQKLHILLLISFLGGIIAPACGFAWGGNFSVVEICTTEGIETRLIESDEKPADPKAEGQCEFCFTQANLTTFLPKAQNLEKIAYASEKIRFGQYQDIVLSKYQSNISSRGPPSFI